MKARDLRIGNLVNRLGEPTVINSVQITDNKDFGYVSTPLSGSITQNQIEPIPLTEEWLVKFGFHRTNRRGEPIYALLICEKSFRIEVDFMCLNNTRLNGVTLFNDAKLRYVHQLQNLYFVLAGRELELVNSEKNIDYAPC